MDQQQFGIITDFHHTKRLFSLARKLLYPGCSVAIFHDMPHPLINSTPLEWKMNIYDAMVFCEDKQRQISEMKTHPSLVSIIATMSVIS